jgi:hypothetical protein
MAQRSAALQALVMSFPCLSLKVNAVFRQQASGIPNFYVAFCVTPFASNASELVSSFIFSSRKQKKNISLTFSQVPHPKLPDCLHTLRCG